MPRTGAPGRYGTDMPWGSSVDSVADASVHPIVRKTAAWSWRLLVILAAMLALLWVIKHLEFIVVPVALATMLAAMLMPVVDLLDDAACPAWRGRGDPDHQGFVVVGGILTFVVSQFIEGAPALVEQVTEHQRRSRSR